MNTKPWEKMGKGSGFGHGAERMKRLRNFRTVTAEAFGPLRGERDVPVGISGGWESECGEGGGSAGSWRPEGVTRGRGEGGVWGARGRTGYRFSSYPDGMRRWRPRSEPASPPPAPGSAASPPAGGFLG